MPYDQETTDLATRVATEFNALRALTGALASLDTSDKTNLVAAINETLAAAGAGGVMDFNGLTDVVISSVATGHGIRYNGTNWVNGEHWQPKDSDLDAIAALSTTAYGRGFLTLANQAALQALLAAASETAQGIVELATSAEAIAGADTARAVTPAGLAASIAAGVPSASETVAGRIELATQAEVNTGTDAVRAVTPATLATRIGALIGAAPGALDTLSELADALADDPNFAATMTTALAGKQAAHANLDDIAGLTFVADRLIYANGAGTLALTTFTAFARTLLDDADAAAARTTLDVYSKAEVGNPETDYVAAFEAALT